MFLDLAQPPDEISLPFSGIGTAIMCAAVTSQSLCELEPTATRRVNVEHTVALARQLVRSGMFVIFLSSNCVFDGETPQVRADTACCPISEYGRQKAQAEEQLLALGDRVAVVRLGKVLAPEAALLRGWVSQLIVGKPVHPFSDAVMAPVSADFAVDVVRRVCATLQMGVTQVSASQDITYEQAARFLAERLSASPDLIQPVTYRTAGIAHMPRHTTLDSAGLGRLGLSQPDPNDALLQFIQGAEPNPPPGHS